MRYTPFTEEQIQTQHIVPAGNYVFKVIDVQTMKNGYAMVDKNGNDMARIKVMIYDENHNERFIYTYITGADTFAYKLRHLCKTIGMLKEYEAGTFNINHTIGKQGECQVVIRKGQTKSDGSGDMWPDQNDIKDFVVSTMNERKHSTTPSNDFEDSDIPF